MNLFGTAKRRKKIDAEARVALLRALTGLSEVDPLYADIYLDRAEQLLPTLCTRDDYHRLRREREDLPRAVDALRSAADRGEWRRVYDLAGEAAAKKEDVTVAQAALEIADDVYGPRCVHATAASLGLHGVLPLAAVTIEQERARVVERLRLLADREMECATFYRQRIGYFERLEVVPQPQAEAGIGRDVLRLRVLAALERGDFREVRRLAEETAGDAASVARARARMTNGRAEGLAVPFPANAIDSAKRLGLVAATLPSVSSLNGYLDCCCADRATFPSAPLSETHRVLESCTCGHPCPPEVSSVLREGLDFLLVHPFVSSGGTRYLPWFGAEVILVEDFPETAPDTPTPLLGQLGLSVRRGLPRLVIEDALRSHTIGICKTLGLDPFEFIVACIPFDAYTRLSPRYEWGRQQLWTHFDGYQVTRELRLLALVGGDARFGGAEEFCAIQRDYDADRVLARFCVLRRARFLVRHRSDEAQPGAER